MKKTNISNPLLNPFDTPYGTIPFEKIEIEHFEPAFQQAMKQNLEEIDEITTNIEKPTFQNTIEALDKSGEQLDKVSSAFYALLGAESNEKIRNISLELNPKLSEHSNKILFNEQLFQRVKDVYIQMVDEKSVLISQKEKLTEEQKTLLDQTYKSFSNNGANLDDSKKEQLKQINKELSLLTEQFSQNVLKATNAYRLHIKEEDKLTGLPSDVIQMFSDNAEKENKKGWIITLKATSYIPVLTYADNRELRKELYFAYSSRCMSGTDFDNQNNIKKIVNLRLEKSKLLGHKNYAEYVLQRRMAQNRENVEKLLTDLLVAYRPEADKNLSELQLFANSLGADFKIKPWDWAYYSEKLKKEKYNLDNELLKPYFELKKVQEGVFWLAHKLYGLSFKENRDIQVYHPDVTAYDVMDSQGNFIAVFYTDFHPREGKRAGAWMDNLKSQWADNEGDSRPHVINVMNFTSPTKDKPALLKFQEVTTLLHEFGHGLHGMLSKCNYRTLSGTSVYWDFVELPSQIMENWAIENEFLDKFARHYKTGEKIPQDYIEKIKKLNQFNVGYACLRQLGFGFLDMKWHTLTEPFQGDVSAFEQEAMRPAQLLPVVEGTGISQTFSHIFSGGYASGYYSYKWAEVLDADAFSLFQKNGVFDYRIATSFKENILEKGGTEHPMKLYKRFKGDEPNIEAMLERDGLK